MNLKLNEMIDILNKCVGNLKVILHEIKSYSCVIDLDERLKEEKIKLYFALQPNEFINLIERFNLDFCSALNSREKSCCKLVVRMGDIEFFTLLYLDCNHSLSDFLKDTYERELEIVEQFLKNGK